MLPYRRHVLQTGLVLALWPSLVAAQAQTSEADIFAMLRDGNHVLLMRHTNAPGTGDPPGFRLDDCTTQRNLDAGGRTAARRIGERLRQERIPVARIYSSRWCRALETGHELSLGPVVTVPAALDSFFARRDERDASVAALRNLVESLPRDGANTIMVTHQVNVTGLSDIYPASGEIVILPAGRPVGPQNVVGRLRL